MGGLISLFYLFTTSLTYLFINELINELMDVQINWFILSIYYFHLHIYYFT